MDSQRNFINRFIIKDDTWHFSNTFWNVNRIIISFVQKSNEELKTMLQLLPVTILFVYRTPGRFHQNPRNLFLDFRHSYQCDMRILFKNTFNYSNSLFTFLTPKSGYLSLSQLKKDVSQWRAHCWKRQTLIRLTSLFGWISKQYNIINLYLFRVYQTEV